MGQFVDRGYNASLSGIGNIARFDSPHKDHNHFHHVHRYDVFNHDSEGTLESCEWPTLGEVLGELETWFYAHYDRLSPRD